MLFFGQRKSLSEDTATEGKNKNKMNKKRCTLISKIPGQVEVLLEEPRMVHIYHNVVSDLAVEKLKAAAISQVYKK